MAVSKRLRYEILRRDNHTCRYCGSSAPDVALTVDHVVPVTLGGSDEPTNLVTACHDCNSGKSATPPGAPLVDDVAADAERWARAMRATADTFETQVARRRELQAQFEAAWDDWRWGDQRQHGVPKANDWASTVDHWLAAGLTMPLLIDSIAIAMRSKATTDETWRYFCGVVWRRLTEMQDVARQVATALAHDDEEG